MMCGIYYIRNEGNKMIDYTKINSETWDSWASDGCEWSLPISYEEYAKTNADNFAVYLTPCITVPHEWFGDLKDKKVLGLASGGGQQMPVFSKLGAKCTVFDYSDKQLDADRMVAEREGYSIEIIKGDMSKHCHLKMRVLILFFILCLTVMLRMFIIFGMNVTVCLKRAADCLRVLITV